VASMVYEGTCGASPSHWLATAETRAVAAMRGLRIMVVGVLSLVGGVRLRVAGVACQVVHGETGRALGGRLILPANGADDVGAVLGLLDNRGAEQVSADSPQPPGVSLVVVVGVAAAANATNDHLVFLGVALAGGVLLDEVRGDLEGRKSELK